MASVIRTSRVNILGVGVSSINMQMALDQIGAWIARDERQYVCVANVHTVTLSQSDARLCQINNQAGMVTPDGMPLVWLCKLHGHRQVERVYGPELLLAVGKRSLDTGWSHYFYGGLPGVAEHMSENLYKRFPGLKIAGCYSPPFHPIGSGEDSEGLHRINSSGADILWIGLGAPKQEYWMADHLGKADVPVMVGVGAAFDFLSGAKRQAPEWIQRMGFEWLFRLAYEPGRLWKRYLFNNPVFMFLVVMQLLKIKHYPIENNKSAINLFREG
jgi:N-acetylglucosaminyldiphosphoundecaprenol N-acetyl-beta-D-mannosaminyltransferase